jgi:transposase
LLTLPSDAALRFVPVVTEVRDDGALPATAPSGLAAVLIEIGGAIVRAAPGVDLAWLWDVLRVVKAAS